MPEYTCASCGASFSLPQTVIDRYPGWTPKTCRACRGDGQAGERAAGRATAGRRPATRPPVGGGEELLTLAAVRERYHRGPQDGVFTDGSAIPNPGPGGWGAVYVVGGEVRAQDYGRDTHTTNNRMELRALIAGFDLVPEGTAATLHSDSRLVVDTVTRWAAGWERRGWKRKAGPVQNLDLVKEAYGRARARPEIRVTWIKAHDGSLWNEYADALATAWAREEL